MPEKLFRVALIGPESSGKSTLCRQLAGHYRTSWVPEYARAYLEQLNRSYSKDDVLHCAVSQLRLEDEQAMKATDFLFADTELINFKIWLEDKYEQCPGWIESEIEKRKYDLYLLVSPDIPFVADPVRENPDRREHFFNLYKAQLEQRGFRFEVIRGPFHERLRQAIRAIDKTADNPSV
jgi:NadR type nicotinamide-nucleotide adenylyltransferase